MLEHFDRCDLFFTCAPLLVVLYVTFHRRASRWLPPEVAAQGLHMVRHGHIPLGSSLPSQDFGNPPIYSFTNLLPAPEDMLKLSMPRIGHKLEWNVGVEPDVSS